jgi:ribosomal protein S28E/S33
VSVILTNSNGQTATSTNGYTYNTPEIASWLFVDGNGANGINKDPTKNANSGISAASFNSKFYVAWGEESAGPVTQARVAVYNGSDSSPSWAFVDGNGATGLNKLIAKHASTPKLIVFNSKLYITWAEYNAGNITQIRVLVYNGDDSSPVWTFVDVNGANGINKNSGFPAFIPQPISFNSKLYLTWYESSSATFISQIRAAVYNSDDVTPAWTFVDGNAVSGINKDISKNASVPIPAELNSKLYVAWIENNGTANNIRVAVYNGNDGAPSWTFVDGNGVNGINKDSTKSANSPSLVAFNSKLYLAWSEAGGGGVTQIRTAVYNGNDSSASWSFVDGNSTNGLNKNTGYYASAPYLIAFDSKLYLAWQEDTTGAFLQNSRIAVYNSSDSSPSWTFIDGNGATGLNKDTSKTSLLTHLKSFNSKLYYFWSETNGTGYNTRAAVGQY